MTKILALDISTRNVGWCLAEDGKYWCSGCLSLEGDVWERLQESARVWSQLTLSWQWKVDIVAFEEPRGQHHNMDTNIKLGYANGIVLAPFLARGARPMPIHLQKIKNTGVCKGEAGQRIAADLVGKESVGPDEADAIGCWLVAWAMVRQEQLRELADEQSEM